MSSVADEVTAIARVQNRRLFIQDRPRFDDAITRLDERWDYEVVVRRLYAIRSQQQNKFYWAVVVDMLSEHTGFTPDEMHEWLKMRFIPKKLTVCDDNGEIKGEFVLGGSTRKMSTAAFGEYIENVRQWAAEELSVVIPDPNGTVLPVVAGGHGWGV